MLWQKHRKVEVKHRQQVMLSRCLVLQSEGTEQRSMTDLWFSALCVQVAAINPSHPLAQMPLPPSMKNCIQLAACEANELLPMNPDLPADLFTSCLTTPIKIALRW